jgi:hypothetical protein
MDWQSIIRFASRIVLIRGNSVLGFNFDDLLYLISSWKSGEKQLSFHSRKRLYHVELRACEFCTHHNLLRSFLKYPFYRRQRIHSWQFWYQRFLLMETSILYFRLPSFKDLKNILS